MTNITYVFVCTYKIFALFILFLAFNICIQHDIINAMSHQYLLRFEFSHSVETNVLGNFIFPNRKSVWQQSKRLFH